MDTLQLPSHGARCGMPLMCHGEPQRTALQLPRARKPSADPSTLCPSHVLIQPHDPPALAPPQLVSACTSVPATARRVMAEIATTQPGSWVDFIPSWVIAKQVLLVGVLWAIQILIFPFRIRWAAPVQLAAATAGALAMRGLGCAVAGEPQLAAPAVQLCMWTQAASGQTLSPIPRLSGGALGFCSEASIEFFVAFVFVFSSLMPVSVHETITGTAYAGCTNMCMSAAACGACLQPPRRTFLAAPPPNPALPPGPSSTLSTPERSTSR
jgi:hypothetical protein